MIDRLNSEGAFRALRWLFVAVLLVFGSIPIINTVVKDSHKDYELWHDTGQKVLQGDHIYPLQRKKFPFMYPPPAALLLAPVSLLGQTGLVIALVLLNAAAWTASILLSVRLATGTWKRPHPLVLLVPSLVIVVYAWSNFHLGQPTLLLLVLTLGAFVALQAKRQVLAGALVGLAAGIKAFPLIIIVYLIYRRYWVAAASLVLALVFLLIVLPTPFRGFDQARTDLRRWTEGMLLKYDDTGVAQRPGRSNSWKNQSIFGVANRLLRHEDADERFGPHTPVYVNFTNFSFETVNRIIVGTGLLLGILYVAVMPRRNRRTTGTDAIEFALLVLLMLVFTPLSFGYLFASLLFPFTVLVQRWLQTRSPLLLYGAMAAVVLLVLTIPFQKTAQMYGNTLAATLVLCFVLASELYQLKSSDSATPQHHPARGS
ncbi:hypothetical protein BH20VER2_BH20VER2_07100 [soil metagenome]